MNAGGKDSNNQESEILKDIIALSEHTVKSNQLNMTNEIENYIENNMKEMFGALEELRLSFDDEIKSVDGKNKVLITTIKINF